MSAAEATWPPCEVICTLRREGEKLVTGRAASMVGGSPVRPAKDSNTSATTRGPKTTSNPSAPRVVVPSTPSMELRAFLSTMVGFATLMRSLVMQSELASTLRLPPTLLSTSAAASFTPMSRRTPIPSWGARAPIAIKPLQV